MDKPFAFKVNGVEIYHDNHEFSAEEILKLAKEKGAIPREPKDYILQGEKGKYKPDEQINLKEDALFIAIPNQPTPVA